MQFCSSNGKYLTSMAHELRKMTIDNHVTLPFDVTMTLVLMEDLYDDTSALYIRPQLDRTYCTYVIFKRTCVRTRTLFYRTLSRGSVLK